MDSTGQKTSGTIRITPEKADVIPADASRIGVDADGAPHYLGDPVQHDGIPVYVDAADGVEEWDLTETPCGAVDGDAVDAWIDHVERKRGEWQRILYGRTLTEMLADAVEGEN